MPLECIEGLFFDWRGDASGFCAAYLAASTMYCTAARMSSSEALAAPPLGGIGGLPCIATLTMASMPVLMYGSQAALSPNLGALATPVAWQAKQTLL